MRTEHGLIIKKVDHDSGGFDVVLDRPAEDDHKEKTFATLKLDRHGAWCNRNSTIRNISLADAIGDVDGGYAIQRRQRANAESQRQEEILKRNAEFAPAWQEVISRFGNQSPTEE